MSPALILVGNMAIWMSLVGAVQSSLRCYLLWQEANNTITEKFISEVGWAMIFTGCAYLTYRVIGPL